MKKRILLVNEDPAVRRMMFRVLTGEGHQVIMAEPDGTALKPALHGDLGTRGQSSFFSPQDTLEKNAGLTPTALKPALHGDFDVVILDSEDEQTLNMLERWGPEGHLPPTILLTNRVELIRSRGIKVLAVMEKPLDLAQLLEMIERVPSHAAAAAEPQDKGLASAA